MPKAAAALVVLLLTSGLAGANCGPAETKLFVRAASDALQCKFKELKRGHTLTCAPETPPACAADAYQRLDDVFGLGAPTPVLDPTLYASQILCQRTLLRDAMRFLKARTRDRQRGRRPQRRSSFRKTGRFCSVVATPPPTPTLPALSGTCVSVTQPSTMTDAASIIECARPAVERAINEVLPEGRLRPNLVLIVTDDQRWDTLPYMPATMDRLANRGISFTNAFSTTPTCGPSRATFFTGRYAHNHGVVENNLALFDENASFAPRLRAAGYHTGLIGKYFNGYQLTPTHVPPGWDDWRAFVESGGAFFNYSMNINGAIVEYGSSPSDYSTDVVRGMTIDFIRQNRSNPFLLVVTPSAPHFPFTPAPRHLGQLDSLPPHRPASWREPDVTDKPPLVRFLANNTGPGSIPARDQLRIRQLESLLSIDEAVEKMVDTLDQAGLTDNTLILYTSDHGYSWDEHWISGKSFPYDEMVRIPFVLRYPVGTEDLPAGTSLDELVANLDIAPTLTSLAGAAPPTSPDGQNLMDLFSGQPWREELVIEDSLLLFGSPWIGLRTDHFKYVRNSTGAGPFEELYDLHVDPLELDNVASAPAYQATLSDLSDRLDEILPE